MKIEKNEFDGSVVTLDTYNSDLNLVIDGSRYSAHPLTDQGFAFMWAGARATHGVNKGKICYEVKVVKQLDVSHLPADEPNPHVIRVGFSVESSTLQLGEDPLSYGYGGTGKISTNCQFKNFGGSFGEGDCILAFLNMDADTIDIGFAKNGSFLGWAYKVSKNQLGNKALYPHILSKNTSFEVNFGQKDKPICNIPPGFDAYKFISCVPGDLREHGTQPPARREDCEMIMMCGLPGAGKSIWAADYSTKNPQKKFNVLGTNNIIDKMKVMGLPRKRNYHGRWDVLIQMATKCLNKEFEIGSKLCRNYVLDQTNVYPTAQRRKMRNFEGFQRSAVVVVPTEEEYKRRCDKRDKEEGKEIPDHAVLEMKANFKLPEVCDIFDKVMFTELQQNEAETLVRMYNEEGRAAIGPANKRFRPNDSSPRGRSFSNSGDYGGHQTYRGGRGGYDSGSYGRGSYSEQSQQGGYGSGSDQSSRGFGGNNYGRGGPQGRGGHSESGLSQDQGYSDSGYGQEGSSYTGYASERSYQSGGGRGGGSGRGGRGVGGRGSGGGNRGFGGDRGFGDSRGRGRGGGGDRGFGDSRGRGRGGGDRGSGNSRGFGGGRGGSGNRSGISSYSNEADDFNKGGYGGDSVLGSHGSESLLGSYGDGTSGGYGSGGSSSSYSGSGRPRSEGSFNKDMGYGSSGLDDYNQGSGYGSSGGNYNDGGNRSAGGNYNDGGNRSAGGNYDGGNRSSGGNYDGGNRSAGGNYDGGNRSSGGNYNDGGNRSAGGNYDDGGNRSAGGFNNDGKYGSGGSGFNKGGGYRGRGTGGRGAPRGGANHGFSTNQNNREGMSNQGNDSRNWTSSSSSQQSNITSDYQSTYGSTATEDNSASTGYGGYGQSYDNSYKPQSQGYQQYGYQSPTNPTPTAQTWAPTNPPPTAAPPQTAVQPQQSQWVSYSQQPPPQQQYYNQYYGQQGSTSTTGPVYGTGAYTPN